jgi:filamentous hemagglutinin
MYAIGEATSSGSAKSEGTTGIETTFEGGTASGTDNIATGAKLKEFYSQAEKYGTGSIKELESGKFRFYGDVKAAAKEGEMAGARLVREWDPATGATRTWYETVDHAGNIRQVRPNPDLTGGVKTHYMFDVDGNYTSSWIPKK